MKAVILAAGKWTRLRPITNVIPKPLIEVKWLTLMHRILEQIPDKITEILIVVDYLWECIIDKIGYDFDGKKIDYRRQNEWESWTLWALYACKKDLLSQNDDFLIVSADNIYNWADLEKISETKRSVLIYKERITDLFQTPLSKYWNSVLWSDELIDVDCFKYINTWVYSLDKDFLKIPYENVPWSLELSIPHTLLNYNNINFIFTDYWFPVWDPQELLYANLKC